MVFDFIAVTIAFGNRGPALRQPATVHLNFVVATYRDGCKIRDRYADNSQLRVAIISDAVAIYETDLPLNRASETKTRNGNLCMEIYDFEMPFDSLSKLAATRKATFIVGPRSVSFQQKHLDALKVLVGGIGRY